MNSTWGILTIGASPVRITTDQLVRVSKLSFQVAPGATGAVKVGGAGLTTDNTTPGTVLDATAGTNPDGSAQPGGSWGLGSNEDANTIHPSQYYVHGTHAGDLVFYEYHQN